MLRALGVGLVEVHELFENRNRLHLAVSLHVVTDQRLQHLLLVALVQVAAQDQVLVDLDGPLGLALLHKQVAEPDVGVNVIGVNPDRFPEPGNRVRVAAVQRRLQAFDVSGSRGTALAQEVAYHRV